jgi:hypothetical protein
MNSLGAIFASESFFITPLGQVRSSPLRYWPGSPVTHQLYIRYTGRDVDHIALCLRFRPTYITEILLPAGRFICPLDLRAYDPDGRYDIACIVIHRELRSRMRKGV